MVRPASGKVSYSIASVYHFDFAVLSNYLGILELLLVIQALCDYTFCYGY